MNVGIIYGWSEGEWQGKLLRKELRDQGFNITSKLETADILIAHSGGCYMLPENGKANLILLIGLPWHPTEHPIRGLIKKVGHEVKDLWWYKKTAHNIWYLVTKPRRWIRMYRAWKSKRLPKDDGSVLVAIRNEDDHFMHPVEAKVLAKKKDGQWKI